MAASSSTSSIEGSDPPVLRHRSTRERDQNAIYHVSFEPNDGLDKISEDEEEIPKGTQKTFGRTPDNTIFTVPTTHDMVSQLLDPRQPKNWGDLLVLAILMLHIYAAYRLPAGAKRPVFALLFFFWRASYNVGIGMLLMAQSKHRHLVTLARRWKLFENPSAGQNPRPWLYWFLKRELEAKVPEDYEFEKAPIEYNTWLLFRRVVDLILMCDFISYCLVAVVFARQPEGEGAPMTVARWIFGLGLVGFNLWVKLDAHRVVKDYAWYWGDFFFLIDQELTFDGVFEMAPHPMYSIGYAGYYGISMMAASYDVLFISIVAHLAQLAFLVIVENPHIEKTYNPPPSRKRTISSPQVRPTVEGIEDVIKAPVDLTSTIAPATSVHRLLGLRNLDLHRSVDYAVILLTLYMTALATMTPNTALYQVLFVTHAFVWRLWYSIGLGSILRQQSRRKSWTRHFVKFGESTEEAWRQWKGLYHISMTMCYVSLVAACWKLYFPPQDWSRGLVLLKHVVGASLVALQLWTAFSVYDSLGEFGWFFGDFFFNHEAKLTYKSIYRFLNNPERLFGTAGIWGAAMITWSPIMFIMALATQMLTLGFISFVEKPHMQKIYGRKLRREAGLTKFIKRSLPPPVKGWQESMDRVLDETSQFVQEFLEVAKPKLASGVETIVRDTSTLFKYPARLTVTRLSPNLAGIHPEHYSLEIFGTPVPPEDLSESQFLATSSGRRLIFSYGSPIKVQWTAPTDHSPKDWIGLYRVTDNLSREATEVSSFGRWVPTVPGVYDSAVMEKKHILSSNVPSSITASGTGLIYGEVLFEGDRLWWTQGVFEFRYHHDDKHDVMSVSAPFEIMIRKFENLDDDDGDVNPLLDDYQKDVELALFPVVRNCLDRDSDIAPSTVDEPFGAHVERDGKYAKRIVYAVHQMFGIEFAPAVVLADGNVKKLAWRICNAKQVLAPYSMSASRGTATPTSSGYEGKELAFP